MSQEQPVAEKRFRRRRTIIISIAAVATVALVAVCLRGVGFLSLWSGDDTTYISVVDDHIAFRARVPDGTAIRDVSAGRPQADGCDQVRYRLTDHGLTFEAFSLDCDITDDQRIINGHHGMYRALEDVPEPREVEQVESHLGPTEVFVQTYTEHTNFTSEYEDIVAIVALTHPIDPDFPALVVRSSKSEMDREAFTEMVAKLIEPAGLDRSD